MSASEESDWDVSDDEGTQLSEAQSKPLSQEETFEECRLEEFFISHDCSARV